MKAFFTVLLAGAAWCQTPGLHGRSTNMHAIGQRPGYLGVAVAEVTAERAQALKLAEAAGVEVTRVDENSPAAKAGLKQDDVILEVNGQKIEKVLQFITTIGVSAPGAKMSLILWRGGVRRTLAATLEARPEPVADGWPALEMTLPPPFEVMSAPNPIVGMEGETLTPQLALYFGVKEGVLVMTVTPKTPAEKAGLKAGDVVVKVSGTPVTSIREISGLIRAAHKTIAFTVVRNHKEIVLNIELALESDPWHARPQACNGSSSSPSFLLL